MRIKLSSLRSSIRKMLSEGMFVSHSSEPSVGDHVVNTNPGCKHYGSEGVVLNIVTLPGDMGKGVEYKCTNSGESWASGDVLYKTMDQLSPSKPER